MLGFKQYMFKSKTSTHSLALFTALSEILPGIHIETGRHRHIVQGEKKGVGIFC